MGKKLIKILKDGSHIWAFNNKIYKGKEEISNIPEEEPTEANKGLIDDPSKEQKEEEFKCKKCQKTFKEKRWLSAHIRYCKK